MKEEMKKRTFTPTEWDVEIDETMGVSATMPEQYQRKMKIVEALQGREDLTEEEVNAVEKMFRKKRKD